MPLRIFYPFKPYQITQKWGVENPAYSEKFGDPAFKRHNGIDARTGYYTWEWKNGLLVKVIATEYPVYCPVEGFVVENVRWDPDGGGHEIWLKSKEKVLMGDRLCYARLILCHAKKILVKAGYEPQLGELIMIADNTGFSTGLHTHIGLYRFDDRMRKIDSNEATGSCDPALFFTGTYAIDEASAATLTLDTLRYYWEYLRG